MLVDADSSLLESVRYLHLNPVRAYVEFIRVGLAQERRPEFHGEGVADSRVFGDDEFVEPMVGDELLSGSVSLEDILAGICQRYGTSLDELARPGKERAAAAKRAMAAWIV